MSFYKMNTPLYAQEITKFPEAPFNPTTHPKVMYSPDFLGYTLVVPVFSFIYTEWHHVLLGVFVPHDV